MNTQHNITTINNNEMEIITPAIEEFRQICSYAKTFKLDCDNLQSNQFIIARIGGRMAGFARVKENSDCIELSTLGVLPRYRNKGVGHVLIDELLKTIKTQKIYIVTIIPDYFKKFSFKETRNIPPSLKLKKEDCKIHCNSDRRAKVMFFTIG